MTAARRDLYVEQGSSYSRGFFWHHPQKDAQGNLVRDPTGKPLPGPPYDLTGWRGRMQIRASVETPALVTATTENTSGAQIVFGLDPDDPAADPDPTNGRVDIRLDADTTDTLTITLCAYDLKVYDTGVAEHRLLEGSVNVSLAVTRDE